MFAHTSIQLFEQLRRDGYSGDGLQRILRALELALRLFACRFQYTGVPFTVHVIGTASVLSSLKAPVELVAAGLIHNAYETGDFGDARRGATEWKRDVVRRAVGGDVEEYVHAFRASLRWTPDSIAKLPLKLGSLSTIERGVLLLRLADLAEHYRDLGQVYGGRQQRAREMIERVGEVWLRLADSLAGPKFAAELKRLFEETKSADLPDELRGLTSRNASFVLPPRSYRRRLSVALRQEAARIRRAVTSRLVALRP